MTTKGTPQTLNEAIENGLRAYYGEMPIPLDLTRYIETHLKDYLANRFAPVYLTQGADLFEKLWQAIIGKNEAPPKNIFP